MQQQIILYLSSEKHGHKENLKFCSQDQAIVFLNITNLMFPVANYQITFFLSPPAKK